MNLRKIFNTAIHRLESSDVYFGHAVACAEDEVVLLLMFVLKCDFNQLNERAQEDIDVNDVNIIKDMLNKRIEQRIPMAYLTGFVVFAGLRFSIDQRALIPRSPIAELIDRPDVNFLKIQSGARILDLCAGSGCIGMAVAHYYSGTTVDVADIDENALSLAHENRKLLGLHEQVNIIHSDLFDAVSGTYDFIITNPPYVGKSEYADLPVEYTHEPRQGLVSEMDGLYIPIKILLKAAEFLSEKGVLVMEVGYSDEALSALLPDIDFNWLDFDRGGQGVCMFSRDNLIRYQPLFERCLAQYVA